MQYEALVTATTVEVRRIMGDTKYMTVRRYKATQLRHILCRSYKWLRRSVNRVM